MYCGHQAGDGGSWPAGNGPDFQESDGHSVCLYTLFDGTTPLRGSTAGRRPLAGCGTHGSDSRADPCVVRGEPSL